MTSFIETALQVLFAMLITAPLLGSFAVWHHNGKKEMQEDDKK